MIFFVWINYWSTSQEINIPCLLAKFLRFLLMTSQISGPCCDSDIKPDQCKSLVWESHVRQQIFVVFEHSMKMEIYAKLKFA